MNDATPHNTIDDLVKRWAVHRMTVMRLIDAGKLRVIRIGRAIRVSEVEVRRFEQAGPVRDQLAPEPSATAVNDGLSQTEPDDRTVVPKRETRKTLTAQST